MSYRLLEIEILRGLCASFDQHHQSVPVCAPFTTRFVSDRVPGCMRLHPYSCDFICVDILPCARPRAMYPRGLLMHSGWGPSGRCCLWAFQFTFVGALFDRLWLGFVCVGTRPHKSPPPAPGTVPCCPGPCLTLPCLGATRGCTEPHPGCGRPLRDAQVPLAPVVPLLCFPPHPRYCGCHTVPVCKCKG